MSDPAKPAITASGPDAPPAARDTLNSSIEESALTQAHKAEGAEPGDDSLNFLSPPQAEGELGRLAGYRILRVLGQGGMGMVLEAEDVRLKRHIAIKVMKPEVAAKESHRQRFLREAQAAATVEHDHIIPIFQIGEENGVPFIAMPFLKGEPLDARMKHSRLQVPEMLQIGRQIAEGLAAAHEHGLVHRDIKPGNVWLERSASPQALFRVKILDFGLARLSQDEVKLTQSGAILGTPAYMAPEQARGQAVDHRADLFSLGVVLYEMATGNRPFTGNDAMAIISSLALDTPTAPIELNPDLPPIFSRLIMRLLEKEPAKRVQSAIDVVDVLKRLQPEATVVVIAAPQPKVEANPWQDIDASSATNAEAPPLAALREVTKERAEPRERPGYDETLVAPNRSRGSARPWLIGAGLVGAVILIVALMNRGKNDLSTDSGGKADAVNKDTPKKDVPIIAKKMESPPPIAKGPEVSFDLGNGINLEVVKINAKGKKFLMGSPKDEPGREVGKQGFDPEEQHELTFGHDYHMGKYEVTQEQYEALMGTNPSKFPGAKNPVEMVSWNDAQEFIKKLNEKFKDRKVMFRLPSEAEWEFACQAEKTAAYHFGNRLTAEQANTGNQKDGSTKAVGSYKPNAFGLYDMHGNVWEWCEDYYGPFGMAPRDGTAQIVRQTADLRVRKGGSWGSDPTDCRSAQRDRFAPGNRYHFGGFRVAVDIADDSPLLPKVDADRAAAEWVLRDGGRVVLAGKTKPSIKNVQELPPGPIQIISITRDASGPPIAETDLDRLLPLTALETLVLGNSPLSDAGMEKLARASFAPNLRSLNLQSLKTTSAGFAHLQHFPKLETLALYHRKLDDADMAHLKQLPALRQLLIGAGTVSVAGLEVIGKLSNLRELGLTQCGLTDAGLEKLKGLKLETLSLGQNGITDEGLRHLHGMTTLQELRWSTGNKVTQKAINELAAVLPNCRITWPDGEVIPKKQPNTKFEEISFDLGNGVKLELMKINAKGKKFLMGSPKDEPERPEAKEGFDPEEQHAVTFGHDYYMGKYELTQEQYEAVVESNSLKFKGVRNPVAQVSWNDAQEFLTKLNDRFKNQKVMFRLPSEAEWEYACRAGTETAYSFGKTLTTQEANIGGTGSKPVGSYPANPFGLYDMHGNVREWCEDYYGPYDKAPKDGTAQTTKQSSDVRVVRGGGWFFGARPCRSAFRNSDPPASRLNGLGFRIAVDIADDSPVLSPKQ